MIENIPSEVRGNVVQQPNTHSYFFLNNFQHQQLQLMEAAGTLLCSTNYY